MRSWDDFITECGYVGGVSQIASLYPDLRSITIHYDELDDFDPDFAEWVERVPDEALEAGKKEMLNIIYPLLDDHATNGMRVHIRVKGLPRTSYVAIRDLRQKNMGRLLAIEGLAKRVTEVRPQVVVAHYTCERCGAENLVPQDTPFLTKPLACSGCGRAVGSTKFTYSYEKSVMIDAQKIELQERPEGLRGGAQPQSISCYVHEDLCGIISPGDKVVLTGVIRAIPKGGKRVTHDIYMDVNHIDLIDVDTEEIEITPEEMGEINRLKELPTVQDIISGSIAPTVYGYGSIKRALMLQMFGGVSKQHDDGTRLRGDIHVLLVGDPGTAKSQMLRYMSRVTPRGIFTSGKSSSAAGLTAAAIKDEFGEGRWTLEAGALVLADGGLAAIDELDKMTEQDRSSMHEAMEQQTVSVSKAGITATLQCRCSLLAAANPRHGRFNSNDYIADQIDLPPTLFSRFDLIFPIYDMPNAEVDGEIADHILLSHLSGQARRFQETQGGGVPNARLSEAEERIRPIVPPDILRKYVFLARKIYPVMDEEAMTVLKEYYQDVRKLGEAAGAAVPITARQLEALIRLSEASARSRMSWTVEAVDADVATEIMREFLDRVVGRGGGGYDIDITMGVPKSQRDLMSLLERTAAILSADGAWAYAELEDSLTAMGVAAERIPSAFDHLKKEGGVYQKGTVDGKPVYMSIRD